MKEIYDWVPWFHELARKIANEGEQYLIKKSKEVQWRPDDDEEPLLRYGNDNIDPFSFFCTLASKNTTNFRKFVYPSVHEVFKLTQSVPSDPEHAFTFPTPSRREKVLFHQKGEGNSELLWNLFRHVVKDPDGIRSKDFKKTLEIKNVGVQTLTRAMCLINPDAFFPLTSRVIKLINWTDKSCSLDEYKDYLNKVKSEFPGCKFHEIDRLLYSQHKSVKKNDPMVNKNSRCFLVNTRTEDQWQDFDRNNHVYVDVDGESPQISPAPERGDIILVFSKQNIAKGIGIVDQNEYQEPFGPSHPIHVMWMNKRSVALPGNIETTGFGNNKDDIDLFKKTKEFARTFELIDEMAGYSEEGEEENDPPAINSERSKKAMPRDYPLNQILYGPPGTGKTYKTKELSLRILGEHQGDSAEDDDKAFRELQYKYDPEKETGSGQIAMITFHQNYAYEDFIEGIKPVTKEGQLTYELRPGIFKNIAGTASKNSDKRYVLIIDEINRGNIAKIFGELITLIEDSRRQGKKDETKVTLPYSMEEFGVPKNLYLIGTMNTADRSIQLLDAALRRRFTFTEMMPVCEDLRDIEGIKLSELLKTINERITALIDREHQIGHTYLMEVKTIEDLAKAFQNKIFPLLQEYFFNDWKKIVSVLGNNSFVMNQVVEHLKHLDTDIYDEQDMKIYFVDKDSEAWRDPTQYQKIYQSNNSGDSE